MEPTTKDRLIEAALETLREEGFAGTSARAVARRGGFNQALIFYHFGTLNDLLLAALDRTSEERLARYRAEVPAAATVEEKVKVATALYREDLETGHVTVLSEMIGGSLSRPDLGPEIVARMEPWVDFAEDALRDALAGTGLEALIPPRTGAYAIVALSLGIDLLAHLGHDDTTAEALFDLAGRLAQLFAPMLGGSSR